MLGMADYIILFLLAIGMAAACRHIFRSWRSGGCVGCGGCGGCRQSTGKKKTEISKSCSCCKSGEVKCGSCSSHK